MEKLSLPASNPSVYRTLNSLTSLSARMLDADPEHLLEWYSVGLYSRQLLYAALHPQEAHESFDIEQEAVHYSMADLAEDEEVPSCT